LMASGDSDKTIHLWKGQDSIDVAVPIDAGNGPRQAVRPHLTAAVFR
jgi:hypothetical protein